MSGEKHTILEWRDHMRISKAEFARYAKITPFTMNKIENFDPERDKGVQDTTLYKIINGIEKFYQENPGRLGDWVLPKRPSDFAGLVIYDPTTMRDFSSLSKDTEKNTN